MFLRSRRPGFATFPPGAPVIHWVRYRGGTEEWPVDAVPGQGMAISEKCSCIDHSQVIRTMSIKKLQRFQKQADARWGFDFDIWDRIVDPQRSLPGVLEDVLNPEVDGLVRRLEYIALALGGEVGELANAVKKIRRHLLQGGKLDVTSFVALQDEAADIFAYLLKLSNLLAWDLEELYLKKMERNEERFAPTGSQS